MNIEELKQAIEEATIGLYDKDELLNLIQEASKELENLEAERDKVKASLESMEEQYELAGDDKKRIKEIADEYGFEYDIKARHGELMMLCKEYEDGIKSLQQELGDYRNFNKRRCFENIRFLLKEKTDVKIGQIEKEAGVSLGYMSRMEKPGNSSEPSAEFIVTAAKMLGVSLDLLALTDMAAMNPTEKYLATLMEKLNKDTIADKLEWHRDSADSLNRMETDMNGNIEHPLFSMETFYEETEMEYPEEVTRIVFTSHTFDCHTYINGECFRLNMKGDSTLYLMDISKSVHRVNDPNAYAKEIWINTPGVGTQFLTSNRDVSQLSELVEILFDTVKRGSKHPKIKKNIKSVLDAFIDHDDLGEDDNLPFY